MAIAAGGKIEQCSVEDRHARSVWRDHATIVFNVQILNALAFQQVTGRAPPESPISATVYSQHNLPFFKMYEEPSTVSGAFRKVKTVGQISGKEETSYKFPVSHIGPELGTSVDASTTDGMVTDDFETDDDDVEAHGNFQNIVVKDDDDEEEEESGRKSVVGDKMFTTPALGLFGLSAPSRTLEQALPI